MWITVTVSSDPPVLSNRCWTQPPAWSFEIKNLIILWLPYETSCTGYWFYRGTTINSVYSCINAYIVQHHHISSITVYRPWFTPLGSNSASHSHLTCPRIKLVRYGDHSFGASGTKIWNELPVDLLDSSLSLLAVLFQCAYCVWLMHICDGLDAIECAIWKFPDLT